MITKEQAIEILKGDFSKVPLNKNDTHSGLFTQAFNMAIEALRTLQHYKDLEEQGRLIESQYMAGETVWCLQEDYEYNWDVAGYKFMGICGDYIIVTTEYIGMTFKKQLDEMCEEVAAYGSTDIYIFHKSRIFTTKAEAEARLKEMEGTQE